MNIFISYPINVLTRKQDIEYRIACASRMLRSKYKESTSEINIIDNYSFFDLNKPMTNLGKGIILMEDADIVYFLKGWHLSTKCLIDFEIAKQFNIDMQFEE